MVRTGTHWSIGALLNSKISSNITIKTSNSSAEEFPWDSKISVLNHVSHWKPSLAPRPTSHASAQLRRGATGLSTKRFSSLWSSPFVSSAWSLAGLPTGGGGEGRWKVRFWRAAVMVCICAWTSVITSQVALASV